MTEMKPKKKKFKYTRELVRIALDEGMTQKDIADLCRVQQSKVSAWSRGESKANEHEVVELKKRFGHRLNRTTSRVYLVAKEEGPQGRWEDTERARRLLEIREQLGGSMKVWSVWRVRAAPPPEVGCDSPRPKRKRSSRSQSLSRRSERNSWQRK